MTVITSEMAKKELVRRRLEKLGLNESMVRDEIDRRSKLSKNTDSNYSDSNADKRSIGESLEDFAVDGTKRLGKDILSGFAKMGHGVINAPHNIVAAFSPKAAEYIPKQQDYDYDSLVGIRNTDFGDKLVQGLVEYAPYAIGGEAAGVGKVVGIVPRGAAQAAEGGVFGATQNNDALSGALAGALGGAGGALASGAVGGLVRGAKDNLIGHSAPSIARNIERSIGNLGGDMNQLAFKKAESSYEDTVKNESNLHNELEQSSKKHDKHIKYDNSRYKKSLKNEVKRLDAESSRQSSLKPENDIAVKKLKLLMKDNHNSFSGAIEHHKSINKMYGKEVSPGNPVPESMIRFAHKEIKKDIQRNIDKNSIESTFGRAWKSANNATQDRVNTFDKIIGSSGREAKSKFKKFYSGKSDSADASAFVKDYIPKPGEEGVQKIKALSKILGDENFAKNVIKHNMFKSSIDKNNIESFVNKFDSLSNEQKDYLFDDKQRNMVGTLSRLLKSKKDVLSGNEKQNAMKTVLSTALGYGGAHYVGADPLTGLVVGGLAPSVYNKVLSSVMSHPGAQNLASADLTSIGNQLRKVLPSILASNSVRRDTDGN